MARRKIQNSNHETGKKIKDSAIKLGRNIVQSSGFVDGQKSPAFSRQINTQLTYGEANLGMHIKLPKMTNHIAQDLMTDLFWSMFQLRHVQKPNSPSGREFSRHLLSHLTNMPTFKNGKKGTLGRVAPSVAASRALLKELLEDDEIRDMMNQLSKMEGEPSDDDDKDEDDESESDENSNGKGKGNGKGRSQEQDDPSDDQNESEGDGDEDSESDDTGDGDGSGGQDENEDEPDSDTDDDGNGESDGGEQEEQQQSGNFDKRQEIINRLKEKLETIDGSIGATAAVAEGFDEGNEVGKLIASLGMNENSMTPEEIEKVMNVVGSDDFKKLSNLIGRSYGTAKDVLRGRSTIPLIIDEAGSTKDIDDIFDDELALMSPDVANEIRREQIGKFMRSGLSGMTRTSQNQYGGTKIFALDESGSTSSMFRDAVTGKLTEIPVSAVERGFALGLCRAAKSQGQSWYMFGWSSPDEFTETISHKDRIGKVMDFIAYNIDGGMTSFDTALGRSLAIMLELPEDERYQTDIVIITDGQGSLYEDVVSKYKLCKKEYGTRLYVIVIGDHKNSNLESVADYTMQFTSMADASGKMAELMWIEREHPKQK